MLTSVAAADDDNSLTLSRPTLAVLQTIKGLIDESWATIEYSLGENLRLYSVCVRVCSALWCVCVVHMCVVCMCAPCFCVIGPWNGK